jgi:hypothetical protein
MAGTRTDLAAPILRADATRPQISGYNSVPRRAGRAAFAVRSAPIAAIKRRKVYSVTRSLDMVFSHPTGTASKFPTVLARADEVIE